MSYGNPTRWIPSEVEADQVSHEILRFMQQFYSGTGASLHLDSQFYYSDAGDPSKLIEITEGRDSAVQINIQRNRKPRGTQKYTVGVKILGRSEGVAGLVTKHEKQFSARDEEEIKKKLMAK